MIKFCLSKFLFLLSSIIIDKFYELYLTFSCFFFGCFVKNYGINYTILFNNVIHIGNVNSDNRVEIKTSLDAKSAFPLYF